MAAESIRRGNRIDTSKKDTHRPAQGRVCQVWSFNFGSIELELLVDEWMRRAGFMYGPSGISGRLCIFVL